jgi:hypothetical protein
MSNNMSKLSESELMKDSHEIFIEKKEASQQKNLVAKETAKIQGIEKPVLARCSDYLHYRGLGWQNNDPLEKDPEERFPDRVSPVFRKLVQLVKDLDDIGHLDFLDVYLDAVKAKGIEIIIKSNGPRVNDIDETWQAIENMSSFQSIICKCNDEIVDVKAVEAEDINFTPKNEFKKVLTFYDKKQNNKPSVDDQYQDWITHLEMTETAVSKVYDESLS